MSVLIKGMEMPKNCDVCFMRDACEYSMPLGKRLTECPLVEIPPHGRLIDVNALYVTAIDITDLPVGECLMVYLKEDIDNAPTIIESTIGQLNSDSAVNEAEEGE